MELDFMIKEFELNFFSKTLMYMPLLCDGRTQGDVRQLVAVLSLMEPQVGTVAGRSLVCSLSGEQLLP